MLPLTDRWCTHVFVLVLAMCVCVCVCVLVGDKHSSALSENRSTGPATRRPSIFVVLIPIKMCVGAVQQCDQTKELKCNPAFSARPQLPYSSVGRLERSGKPGQGLGAVTGLFWGICFSQCLYFCFSGT